MSAIAVLLERAVTPTLAIINMPLIMISSTNNETLQELEVETLSTLFHSFESSKLTSKT